MGCALTVCTGASDSRGEHRLLLHNSSHSNQGRELWLSQPPAWLPISTEHFRFIEYCDWKYELDHARAVQTVLVDRYGSINEVILLIHSMLAGSIFRCERTVEYNFDGQIKHEYQEQYSIEELQFRFESALVKTLLDIDLSQTGNSTSATLLDSIIQHSGRTHFRRTPAAGGTSSATGSVKLGKHSGSLDKSGVVGSSVAASSAAGVAVDSDSDDDRHRRGSSLAVVSGDGGRGSAAATAKTAASSSSVAGDAVASGPSAFDVGPSPMRHVLRLKIVDFAQSTRKRDAYTKTVVLENGQSIYFDITEEGAWHNLTKSAFDSTDVFLIVVRFSKASYTGKASAWMHQFWKYKKRVIDRLRKRRRRMEMESDSKSPSHDRGKDKIMKDERKKQKKKKSESVMMAQRLNDEEQDDFDGLDRVMDGDKRKMSDTAEIMEEEKKEEEKKEEEERPEYDRLQRDSGRLQLRHSSDFDAMLSSSPMTAAIDTLGSSQSSVEPSPERLYSSPPSRLSMSSTADTFSELLDHQQHHHQHVTHVETRRESGSASANDAGLISLTGLQMRSKTPSLLPTLSVLESVDSEHASSLMNDGNEMGHIPAVVFCAAGIRHPVWDVHNPVLIPQMVRFAHSHNLPFVEVNVDEHQSLGTGSSEDVLALFEFMYKYQMCHQHFVVSQLSYF